MAKFIIHKTKDYTTMSNYHFREKQMSLKAKGLLSLMLSLPEDWDYSEVGLAKLSKDGVGSTAKALEELEIFGYLRRTQSKENNGKFAGYEYDIFENPQINLPYTENPFTENEIQLNTNELNYTLLNDNHKNTKSSKKEITKDFTDVVLRIFDYWNAKKIIPHRTITTEISNTIEKALKIYKEEEIKTYIDRYSKVIGDKDYFWHYKWSLKDFLSRKDAISSFADDGTKWVNYCERTKKGARNELDSGNHIEGHTRDEKFGKWC